jgi:excisionase family DNA binding protein
LDQFAKRPCSKNGLDRLVTHRRRKYTITFLLTTTAGKATLRIEGRRLHTGDRMAMTGNGTGKLIGPKAPGSPRRSAITTSQVRRDSGNSHGVVSMLPKLYTASEACEFLRCSRRTLQTYIQQHRIEFLRTDGKILFEETALAAFVAKLRNIKAPEPQTARRRYALTLARAAKKKKAAQPATAVAA